MRGRKCQKSECRECTRDKGALRLLLQRVRNRLQNSHVKKTITYTLAMVRGSRKNFDHKFFTLRCFTLKSFSNAVRWESMQASRALRGCLPRKQSDFPMMSLLISLSLRHSAITLRSFNCEALWNAVRWGTTQGNRALRVF